MHCMVPQLGVSEVRNLLVDRFNNGNERPLACVKCHEAFVIRWQVGIPIFMFCLCVCVVVCVCVCVCVCVTIIISIII